MPAESWKISLTCTREAAEALALSLSDAFDLIDPPVVVASEPDPARPDDWQLDVYFAAEPDEAALQVLRDALPGARPVAEPLPSEDWVSLSQSGLDPIRAGRFFVHTAAHASLVPSDAIGIAIEAGRAFGTGRHETTSGCLSVIDALPGSFADIIDVGTGSGLLAIAAWHRWPDARIVASDIDAEAIEVAADNLAANGAPPIALEVAAGVDSPALARRAPYDLLIANILAGPLIDLAPSLVNATKPGGTIVLAGLLESQQAAVVAAYEPLGCRLASRTLVGEWPTLVLLTDARRGTGSAPQA